MLAGYAAAKSLKVKNAADQAVPICRVSDSAQLRRQSVISEKAEKKAEVITGKRTKVSRTVMDRHRVRRRKDLGPKE